MTIGLFYPKTGPLAGLLRNLPGVVQSAFDEAGPIHGRRLILRTYDDGSANASTIQVEEKRARNEVFALVFEHQIAFVFEPARPRMARRPSKPRPPSLA